jgi:adenylate kinase family enzyme
MTLGSRVVIIGNSGSGKSTLAQALAFAGHLALFENFAKTKIRFGQRLEIDAFLAELRRG